ncbi:hypothetical protein JCM19045_4014 [Bacillus sp. JCM 19045]|nr:hypothetical protein JCM19045_4014 [Bacillus sp. JCM 19045]
MSWCFVQNGAPASHTLVKPCPKPMKASSASERLGSFDQKKDEILNRLWPV